MDLLNNIKTGAGAGRILDLLERINGAFMPSGNPVRDPALEEAAGAEAAARARELYQRQYNAQRAAAIQNGANVFNMDSLAASGAQDAYTQNLARSAQAVDMLRERRTKTSRLDALQKMIAGIADPRKQELAAANPEGYAEAAIKDEFRPENDNFGFGVTSDGSVFIIDKRNSKYEFVRDPLAAKALKNNVASVVQGDKELFVVGHNGQLINTIPYERKETGGKIGDMTAQQFAAMQRMSRQWSTDTKDYADWATYANQVKELSADQTGMSDYAIVYAFNHMIEPGSVVKEGERDFMLKVQDLRTRMRAWIKNKQEGDLLDPLTRQEIINTTMTLEKIARKGLAKRAQHYEKQAKSGKIDPSLVIQNYFDEDPSAPIDSTSVDADGWDAEEIK